MAKCILRDKSNCLIRPAADKKRPGCVNYCVAGSMSHCSAGAVWDEQKRCKYAEKSSASSRCMHFIEAIDGHCDCFEAQRETRNALGAKKAKY